MTFGERASSLIANPVVGAIEAVLAILTGLTGSLYSAELRSVIAPFIAPDSAGQACWATTSTTDASAAGGVHVFWILLGLTAVLYVARTAVSNRRAHNAQDRLEDAVAKVEALVRTSPPPDYLQALGVMYEKSRVMVGLSENAKHRSEAISIALMSIAKLARMYDAGALRHNEDAAKRTYSANIMWFLPAARAAAWDKFVAFRGPGVTLAGVRGVLALSTAYSANSDEYPDPASEDFALDLPRDFGTTERGWRALPGAPLAFHRQAFEHFHPAVNIAEWLAKYGDFAPSIREEVGAYFRKHTEIGGFMSLPLYRPSAEFQEGISREVVGVLNVHWSDADLLSVAESARKFSDTFYPFRLLIAEQMAKIIEEMPTEPTPGRRVPET